MSSRRRNRDDVGMTLFPFMAVLICTMGSLIMLLVVMVQQARVRAHDTSNVDVSVIEAAQQAADEALALQEQRRHEIEAAIAKQQQAREAFETKKEQALAVQQKIDELQWQAESLRPSYDAVLKDLVDQRLALSHIEQHTRELSAQASKMQAEADLIAQTADQGDSDVVSSRTELDRLNNELAVARDQLQNERDKLQLQKTKYALIPYDGPSGTQRPPIYIECLSDRVVLQPENVVLIGEDFRTPLGNQNPLAIALRAKREFMLKNGMLPNEMEPYPLLIVRPGGATSHAAARSAMKAWESEFGYELVEADIELDYQATDPRLKTLLDDVVIEARGRRKMMFALMNRQRGRQREVLRQSANGGFESVSNGSSSFANGSSSSGDSVRGGFGGSSNDPGPNPFDSRGVEVGQTTRNSSGNRSGSSGGPGEGFARGESAGNRLANGGATNFSSQRGSQGNTTADPFSQGSLQGANSNTGRASSTNAFDSSNQSVVGFRQQPNQPSPQASRYDGPVSSQRPNGFGQNGAQSNLASSADSNAQAGGSNANRPNANGQGSSGTGGPAMQSGSAQAGSSTGSDFAQYQSLAHSRGSGWATRNSGDNVIGVKRPIQIVCETNRLVLLTEKGTRNELQIFTHDGSLPAVIDPFVDAVQSRVGSWGIAGQGLFWRPVLQVQVKSNAEQRYRQLLQLLDQSGIEVIREP